MSNVPLDRRTMICSTGAVLAGAMLAGCSSNASPNDENSGDGGDGGDGGDDSAGATVAAGPGGSLTFEPKEVTIKTGETVTWEFESANHNVSCFPDHSDEISLPDGAEGFGTMAADGDKFATVDKGETFSHTFDTAGTYTYVCVPHVSADMVGTVVVE